MFEPKNRWVRVAACALIAFSTYLLLMIADYTYSKFIFYSLHSNKSQAVGYGKGEDERLRFGLFPGLYESGGFRLLALKYAVAPLGAQPKTLLAYCDEGYGLVKYKSDRFGFRNSDEVWDEREIDVAVIGDSYVHGACVTDGETITGQLNALGMKSINLGMRGNSPIHYAATVKTFVPKLKSAFVAVVFYANDNVVSSREIRSTYNMLFFSNEADYFQRSASLSMSDVLLRVYDESESLYRELEAQKTEGIAERAFKTLAIHAALPYLRETINRLLISRFYLDSEIPYGSKVAIDTAVEACRSLGCTPLFMYIPNSNLWDPDTRAKRYAELLRQYTEKKGAQFLDLTTILAPLGLAAYSKRGPHLSPEGYRRVAERIKEAVTGK